MKTSVMAPRLLSTTSPIRVARSRRVIAVFAVLLFEAATVLHCAAQVNIAQTSPASQSTAVADQVQSSPFTRATPGRVLNFPTDFGAHPDFETEWWYFTGVLWEGAPTRKEPRYGFQLTFFRRAEANPPNKPRQLYLAHAALTDISKQRFVYQKRSSRSELGVAGARVGGLRSWMGDWSAESIGSEILLRFTVPSGTTVPSGAADGASRRIRLLATPTTAPILQGAAGYSAKGNCTGCASHYYSFPQLTLRGEIESVASPETNSTTPAELAPTVSVSVSGKGWMDHEFMTNALQPHQAGWDWISLNLSDGRALMLFRLRTKTGETDFASGTVIETNGESRSLTAADFSLMPIGWWQSAKTTGRYPTSFKIAVPSAGIDLKISSLVPNQELVGENPEELSYWEGAVRSDDGSALGYLELTGYAAPLTADL